MGPYMPQFSVQPGSNVCWNLQYMGKANLCQCISCIIAQVL